jgi:hypothetical protein
MSVVLHPHDVHRTTFQRIPVRGYFTFAAGTPAGQWVKVSFNRYAIPTPRRSGENQRQGAPVTNTGRVKFYVGARFYSAPKAAVIENNPSHVAQEADKHDW